MDEKVCSIGEISKILDISEHTIRKYENDFNLKIPRNDLGHRYYMNQEIELFKRILQWKDKGFTKATIKKMLNRSVDAIEQEEHSLELVTMDKLTGKEMKELISRQIGDLLIEREKKLKEEFENQLEKKLDEQRDKINEQIKSENDKLMKYISTTREEKKKESFFSRIFKNNR